MIASIQHLLNSSTDLPHSLRPEQQIVFSYKLLDVKRSLRKSLPFHCWNYSKQTATQQIRHPEQLAPFMQISVKKLMRNTAISDYFWIIKKLKACMVRGVTIYHILIQTYRSFSLSRNKKLDWKPSSRRRQEKEML